MLKNLATIALGTVAVMCLGLCGSLVYDSLTTQKLIYKNLPLPDFNNTQDYTVNEYAPLVRLEDKGGKFFCSGTVISNDYVLTAAHCLVSRGLIAGMRRGTINVKSIKNGQGVDLTVEAQAAAINTRADYGLVKGDFRRFTKMPLAHTPTMIGFASELPVVVCGFPWGAPETCYRTFSQANPSIGMFELVGQLYPGMSGGPALVMGPNGPTVFAVNSATGQGAIYIAPVIGLFETLEIKVINDSI